MGRIIRITLYFLLAIFAICQIPFVQKGIVKRALPKSMNVVQMKSYGFFPFYVYVPIFVVQKEKQDFVHIKNGIFDLRYFLLHRKIAFNAEQLTIYKQPIHPQSHISVGETLEQIFIMTCFHDFNVESFQYKDKESVLLDYKIDWDLKLSRVKLHAKRNGTAPHPERIEIDGTTKKNDVEEGQIKMVMNGGFGVIGTFSMKDNIVKTELSLQRKGETITKIQPTLDIKNIDKGISIEKLDVISPFFQLAGTGQVSLEPVAATIKDDRFFLKSIKNKIGGLLGSQTPKTNSK